MAVTAKCTNKCPGGRECTCNGLKEHQHHICKDAACVCHTAEAYGLILVTGRERQTVYVPVQHEAAP